MQVLSDKENIVICLNAHIKKFGYRPEHQAQLFLYEADPECKLNYFDFGDYGGIFAERKAAQWFISEEPIAPPAKGVQLFLEVLEHIFSARRGKKVFLEDWTLEFKNKCAEALRPLPYRILRPNTVQYCPMINLKKFDETLAGGEMKGLRYVRNRFLNNHRIDIKDACEVPTDQMFNLLKVWAKARTARDEVWAPDYVKFIQNGFPECAIKRAIYINGILRGLSAGWRIPNSTGYYIYMDIHDYSDEYLGEFVTLDHILQVKETGFRYLDFGGSDKGLLNFKKKFHPEYIYKTYNFSITLFD